MITFTERKIAGLSPRWARFPGFSLLFDAPGTPYQTRDGVELLACEAEHDPTLEFYRRVLRGFQSLHPDRLLQTYGLCPLPPASYHVTAFDVANVDDLPRCHATVRDGLRETLDRLPASEAFDVSLLGRAKEFAQGDWRLTFRYDRLRVSGTVVVLLKPVDEAAYARFLESRAELSRFYRSEFGVGAGESYTPHLSLG